MQEIKDATTKLFDGLVELGMKPEEASAYALQSLDRAIEKTREPDAMSRPDNELRELGAALLSHIDALMPYIEKAIGDAWDKGDYINGPQFGAAIEAFREALTK